MRQVTRFMAAAACGAALAFCCPAVPAQELQNGSFEEAEQDLDNPYGDLAAHWGRWGSWINRESAWKPVRNGKCMIGYHHWQIEEAVESGIYQDIPAVPANKTCTFTVYASRDQGSNAEAVELRLEKCGGYQAIASKVYPVKDLKSGWQKLSISAQTVQEGVRVLVVVKPKTDGDRKGAIKFDDATLRVTDEMEQTDRGSPAPHPRNRSAG